MESLIEDITTRGLAFIDANKSPMNAFRAPEWRETPESWIANYVHHGGSMTTPAYSSSKHQRLGDFLRSLPSYTALLASIDESSDCFWRIEKMFKQDKNRWAYLIFTCVASGFAKECEFKVNWQAWKKAHTHAWLDDYNEYTA